MFPEETSSVAFERSETRPRMSLHRVKRGCEKGDTTTNNDRD